MFLQWFLKIIKLENIYKICVKVLHNVYKSTFMGYCVNIQSIQEKILTIIFRAIRLTKHLVDQLLADYIDNYMQGSGKLDKYGFSLLPA